MNVSKTNVLTDENLRTITLQVVNGLLYLHNNFITHNDLKPSNILLTNDGTVKIADFGVSGLGRIRTDSCGTPAFMAPEGSTFSFLVLFHGHVHRANFFTSVHPELPVSRVRRTARRSASGLLCARGHDILRQVWKPTFRGQGSRKEPTTERFVRPDKALAAVYPGSGGWKVEGPDLQAYDEGPDGTNPFARRPEAFVAQERHSIVFPKINRNTQKNSHGMVFVPLPT